MLSLQWQTRDIVLLADGGLLLPAAATLVVADLHLGKPEVFRAAGIPVPATVNRDTLERLVEESLNLFRSGFCHAVDPRSASVSTR